MARNFYELLAKCDPETQEKVKSVANEASGFFNKSVSMTSPPVSSDNLKDNDTEIPEEPIVNEDYASKPVENPIVVSSPKEIETYSDEIKNPIVASNPKEIETYSGEVESPKPEKIVVGYKDAEGNKHVAVATSFNTYNRGYNYTNIGNKRVFDNEVPEIDISPLKETPENIHNVAKSILKPETSYCGTKENAQPASNKQIEDLQKMVENLTKQLNDERALNNFKQTVSNMDFSKFEKRSKKASEVMYRKDCFDCNGKTIEFKRVKMEPDWNHILKESTGADKGKNLDKLISLISLDLKNQLGGWNRVDSLHVYDSQLIINGVCYMPTIKGVDLRDFPMDTADYIQNGAIAPLFDWSNLKHMRNLTLLSFDDAVFLVTTVADGINLGRRIGISSLFKLLPKLEILIYGDTILRSDELENPQVTKKAIESMAVARRKIDLLDGFHLDVYAGTGGLRGYTWNNLKNYATNRGNKGLLRFAGGTIVRGALATFGLGADLAAHVVGGVKNLFTDATTPVTDTEMYGE